MKNHYYTVEVDIYQLYDGRNDADARMARYLVGELSDWRVRAGNLELLHERMNEALKKAGLSYTELDDDGEYAPEPRVIPVSKET